MNDIIDISPETMREWIDNNSTLRLIDYKIPITIENGKIDLEAIIAYLKLSTNNTAKSGSGMIYKYKSNILYYWNNSQNIWMESELNKNPQSITFYKVIQIGYLN